MDLFGRLTKVTYQGQTTLTCLWPPRHRLVRLGRELVEPIVREACSEPTSWRFAGCPSDQPDDGTGDGATVADCQVAPDGSFLLVRAERQGGVAAGRRHAVQVVATDACGNASAPVVVGHVHVPHDAREAARCR